MEKRAVKSLLVALIILIGPIGCAVKPISHGDELPTLFSLNGQWVVANDSKLMDEVMFDFREGDMEKISLQVWGKVAELNKLRQQQHQFIFKYTDDSHRSFNVLATVVDHDHMKISKIEGTIDDFQPLGKLGEKVYHLKKRNQGDLKLITKIVK